MLLFFCFDSVQLLRLYGYWLKSVILWGFILSLTGHSRCFFNQIYHSLWRKSIFRHPNLWFTGDWDVWDPVTCQLCKSAVCSGVHATEVQVLSQWTGTLIVAGLLLHIHVHFSSLFQHLHIEIPNLKCCLCLRYGLIVFMKFKRV